MTLLDRMSEWICAFPMTASPQAVEIAKHSIEDVIACIYAGAATHEAESVRRSLRHWGKGPAKIIGSPGTAPAPYAALANGTAAHALDYDDTFMRGASHASAVLVPALIALSSEIDYDGLALIDAYVVGLQTQYFLALGCMRSHGDIGWHSTGTLGAISGAAACARLMGLGRDKTAAALSLSTSMMGGMKVQFGTGAKPLHAGLAAQHAIQAATLAREGLSGSMSALEGRMGFLELCGGERAPGWSDVAFDTAKTGLAIEREGLMIKRFPCCAATHRALDCALELQAEHGIFPSDIRLMETYVGHGHARNLMYPDPKDFIEARFSMQYCMAAALTSRGLSLQDFTPMAVMRPDVRVLMSRVQMRAYPPELSDQPHRVVIRLHDGRTFENERDHAAGTIYRPLTQEQRREKFDKCCESLLASRRDELWGVLQNLETLPSSGTLTALL